MSLYWPDVECSIIINSDGLEAVLREYPDFVFLRTDGIDRDVPDTIRELRSFRDIPLVVLADESLEVKTALCLIAGADDYIRFPCGLGELLARTHAILRRYELEPFGEDPTLGNGEQPVLRSGELMLKPSANEAYLQERRLSLTPTEFGLLYRFMQNCGQVMPYVTLWGDNVRNVDSLLKAHIQRLRAKLEDDVKHPRWIETVRRVGYRFIGPP